MPSTVKALAIVPGHRQVGTRDIPAPLITRADQVCLRMLEVGLCGTDREICSFVYGRPPAGCDYLVLGHESLGEVVEVGEAVRHFRPGDLAVASVRRPCPHAYCRPCRNNRQDFCATGDFTERGINQVHGFLTESCVEEEQYLFSVPAALRDIAVLTEPLTIAEKGMAEAFAIQRRLPGPPASQEPRGSGRRAVVLGAGPIGQLGAMKCMLEGFETWVYSRSPAPNPKADIIEAIGAKYISNRELSPAQLAERIGPIDLIYEGVGEPRVVFDLLPHLGFNGVAILTGIPAPQNTIDVAAAQWMRDLVLKNQVIFGTVNADPNAFREAIHDLGEFQRRWPAAVRGVITGRHRLADGPRLLTHEPTGIKNVIALD